MRVPGLCQHLLLKNEVAYYPVFQIAWQVFRMFSGCLKKVHSSINYKKREISLVYFGINWSLLRAFCAKFKLERAC